MSSLAPLDALRAHAALYPQSGLMTANVTITYVAVVADADARIEAAHNSGRLAGYEQRAKENANARSFVIEKETTYGTAPREPRELFATDGRTYRFKGATWWWKQHDGSWASIGASEFADLAPEVQRDLKSLRASPNVPVPKGLREEIAEAIEARLGYTNGWSVSAKAYSEDCDKAAGDVLALIDRERPALGDVDVHALRAELIRRGWTVEVDADIYPFRAQNGKRARLVLIAPERAG